MTKSRTTTAPYSAAAVKLETILNALTKSDSTAVDRAVAERCIAYCRARAAGGRESLKAEAAIDKFVERHGLSLDWLFDPTLRAA